MKLSALEHWEINGQAEVTCKALRTIAHSLMVHVRVLKAYIYFALMYTADHIFLVLTIKDLINESGKPAMSFKLATGMKPSVSYLRVLYSHVLYRKLLYMLTKRR